MAAIPLTPFPIDINGLIFRAISEWSFEEEFVSRILTEDIPQRVKYEFAKVWAYRDPEKNIVGFGSLSLCNDCCQFAGGAQFHTYIPLLAVHPEKRGLGHGQRIVDHLVSEAAELVAACSKSVSPAVFLDVYEESVAAIGLYQKCGLQSLGSAPLVDPVNGKGYRVMAKRVTSI